MLTSADEQAALDLLSDEERARVQRFRFREDARDYAAAHALVRLALSDGTETPPSAWQFDRGANGKPFLSGDRAARASFSLSHTRGMVVCALGPPEVAIGVDVESDQRELDTTQLAARFFAGSETAALDALPEPSRRERFYDYWTLKEAVVKALGLALPPALASVSVQVDGETISIAGPDLREDTEWQLALFTPAAGYRLAVAVARPAGSPSLAISCIGAT